MKEIVVEIGSGKRLILIQKFVKHFVQGVWLTIVSHGNNMQQHFVWKCPEHVFNRISMFWMWEHVGEIRHPLCAHSEVSIFIHSHARCPFAFISKLKPTESISTHLTANIQRIFPFCCETTKRIRSTSSCLPFAFFKTNCMAHNNLSWAL